MSREFNYDAFTHNPFRRMYRVGLKSSLNSIKLSGDWFIVTLLTAAY